MAKLCPHQHSLVFSALLLVLVIPTNAICRVMVHVWCPFHPSNSMTIHFWTNFFFPDRTNIVVSNKKNSWTNVNLLTGLWLFNFSKLRTGLSLTFSLHAMQPSCVWHSGLPMCLEKCINLGSMILKIYGLWLDLTRIVLLLF